MSDYRASRLKALEDPLTYGAGIVVARLRGARERLRAEDQTLAAALRIMGRMLARAAAALEHRRQRRLVLRDLQALDDRILADIGLSRPMLGAIASDLTKSERPAGKSEPCGRASAVARQRCGGRLGPCPAC